jgi:hypothetical protein
MRRQEQGAPLVSLEAAVDAVRDRRSISLCSLHFQFSSSASSPLIFLVLPEYFTLGSRLCPPAWRLPGSRTPKGTRPGLPLIQCCTTARPARGVTPRQAMHDHQHHHRINETTRAAQPVKAAAAQRLRGAPNRRISLLTGQRPRKRDSTKSHHPCRCTEHH